MPRQTLAVNLTAHLVRPGSIQDDYPQVPVFGVEILAANSSWLESFATEAEVRAFLRGVQAGSQMTGGPYLHLPLEIPRPG